MLLVATLDVGADLATSVNWHNAEVPAWDDGSRTVSRARGVLRVLVLDIFGPLAVFKIARSAGLSEVWSLVLSGVPPSIVVVVDWIRWRTLEVVGGVVLGSIFVTLLVALVSHDPKVLMLEGAAFTAAFGGACLGSLLRRRPLIFYFARAFYGGPRAAEGQELESDLETYPGVRFFFRALTIVWGVVYLVESAARVVITLLASTETALLANRTVPWVVYGALMMWSLTWGQRLRSSRPR